jgi:methionyl aminopeptidase
MTNIIYNMSILKNQTDLDNLRFSCRILMSCFHHVKSLIKVGASCGDIDEFATNFIRSYGGEPSFLGYDGFKYAVCSSINDEVAHGISPKTKIIPNNSLVKIDMGVKFKGMFSDSCRTYIVGKPPQEMIDLKERNEIAVEETIKKIKAGTKLGDVGFMIDSYAKKYNYGNVYDLGGHGVGYGVHEKPFVAHQGKKGTGIRLQENQVICIEPMFTSGKSHVSFDRTPEDGWTIKTRDGSWCAQYEQEILIRKDGAEILTQVKVEDILPIVDKI